MGLAKPSKRKQIRYWLYDNSRELLTLGFTTREQAEEVKRKLKTQSRIYEADTQGEAWDQHRQFLVSWSNGRANWS